MQFFFSTALSSLEPKLRNIKVGFLVFKSHRSFEAPQIATGLQIISLKRQNA